MSGTQQSFRAQQRREDLRRSLYRNGATEDDLPRYVEERAALLDAPVPPAERAGAELARHTHRLPVALLVTAVALLAGIGVSTAAQPVHTRTAPTSAASATPLTPGSIQDIGGG